MAESLNLWLENLVNDEVGLRLRLRDCLFAANSPFQRIAVYDSQACGRVLTLGGAIAITDLDEAWYSESLVHPALQAMPAAERVLILGGGDGGVAREVLRYANVKRVTVVEIDQQVVDTCRRFFPGAAASLADPRVELVIDDAHRYLRDTTASFDVVIVDACELENPASDAFHAVPFAQSVFRRLHPGGILVAPLGCPVFAADECRVTLRRVTEKFQRPRVYLVPLPSQPAGIMAVAWCSESLEPTVAAKAELWFGELEAWHPGLQPAMFALPRHVRTRLGLA